MDGLINWCMCNGMGKCGACRIEATILMNLGQGFVDFLRRKVSSAAVSDYEKEVCSTCGRLALLERESNGFSKSGIIESNTQKKTIQKSKSIPEPGLFDSYDRDDHVPISPWDTWDRSYKKKEEESVPLKILRKDNVE